MKLAVGDGWIFEVQDDTLVASYRGVAQAWLPLAPLVDGKSTVIEKWEKPGPDHFTGMLSYGGSIHVALDCGHMCYWMESEVEQFEELTYFPDTSFSGRYWHTYVSDEHDRKWDIDIDQEVGISSSYDGDNPFGADGEGMTDPGDSPPYWIWNVPVRAVSLQTDAGWLGLSLPGALPVGVTRLKMDMGKFSVTFDVLRPCCADGMMPRVYLVPGLAGSYDVLDSHRVISEQLGLTAAKNQDHPSWWSNPEYKYWDEYCRLVREDPEGAANRTILTAERYLDWLNTTKEIMGIANMNACMEQGCYNCYGDYRPTEAMGGVEGVREMVDLLREQGTRVGYYIHPFVVNTKVDFYKEHPEAFCKPTDDSHKTKFALEYGDEAPEFKLLDWTHPLARGFIEQQIRFLFSDEPGCLNCDIVRSNNWESPDPRMYTFHDPDWGIGDLMTCKVQRFIYETAKRIKPDCMVSKCGFAEPYMQPWADVDYLGEEWSGSMHNWYRRGQIATRTIKGLLFLIDAWFVTLTKGYEFYMGMLAWNYPMTMSLRHTIHPYTHYRELKEKDFKRRNSGFHVAMNAPLRQGDVYNVDVAEDGEVEQWRKRADGRLSGFYAALAVGKRTLVTYSETEARIATSITRGIEFPLPPGAAIEKVEMVPHEGAPDDWVYQSVQTSEGPGLRMHVEDCGKRALYYRIRYKYAAQ